MIQGTAVLIEGGRRFRKLRRLLYEKYPQYPEEALEEGVVIVEVTPKHVFSWGPRMVCLDRFAHARGC